MRYFYNHAKKYLTCLSTFLLAKKNAFLLSNSEPHTSHSWLYKAVSSLTTRLQTELVHVACQNFSSESRLFKQFVELNYPVSFILFKQVTKSLYN